MLEFTLLQDLDAVTVNMIYGNGTTRSMKIFLQKDASVNRVAVQSQQFSQEVELGTSATFDLTLELFSGVSNTFSLEVLNLPPQIDRFFKDPAGAGAAQPVQIHRNDEYAEGRARGLPSRPADGRSCHGQADPVLCHGHPARPGALRSRISQTRQWTQEEVERLNVGFVKLELVPRGQGKLLVRAPQLFHTIKPDGSVRMSVELVNEGTRRLDNIEVKIDPPLNWRKSVDPAVVPTLGIGEERRVQLTFTPPPDIAVGRYEIRLRTSGLSDNHPVNAEDKTVTVEIAAGDECPRHGARRSPDPRSGGGDRGLRHPAFRK